MSEIAEAHRLSKEKTIHIVTILKGKHYRK